MRLCSIASGSSGNCIYVGSDNTHLLVDTGISKKKIDAGLKELDIKGEELCPDLPALQQIPVILISAGPKDMLDRKATIDWLISHGVKVIGTERNYCTGYVFCGEKVELQGKAENGTETVKPPMLIINEIPEERRIEDREILREAIAEGKRAEKEGRYFHPAANGKIDDCTDGYSSLIQLRGLIANMKVAETL